MSVNPFEGLEKENSKDSMSQDLPQREMQVGGLYDVSIFNFFEKPKYNEGDVYASWQLSLNVASVERFVHVSLTSIRDQDGTPVKKDKNDSLLPFYTVAAKLFTTLDNEPTTFTKLKGEVSPEKVKYRGSDIMANALPRVNHKEFIIAFKVEMKNKWANGVTYNSPVTKVTIVQVFDKDTKLSANEIAKGLKEPTEYNNLVDNIEKNPSYLTEDTYDPYEGEDDPKGKANAGGHSHKKPASNPKDNFDDDIPF